MSQPENCSRFGTPAAPTEVQLRQAVERIVNDRKGLHWDCLDDAVLAELRSEVERSFTAVLGRRDAEPPTPNLPTIGGFVQLPQAWHSSAGIIQNLVEHAVGGVGILHSRGGSSRAYHWHKEDWHYLYCVSGAFRYTEWEPTGNGDSLELRVGPGQMIFTPPRRAHVLTFDADTVLVSISKLSRTKAEHESDVVRL